MNGKRCVHCDQPIYFTYSPDYRLWLHSQDGAAICGLEIVDGQIANINMATPPEESVKFEGCYWEESR